MIVAPGRSESEVDALDWASVLFLDGRVEQREPPTEIRLDG
jgi:prepilin-type processing-associated H-X9-DG protein